MLSLWTTICTGSRAAVVFRLLHVMPGLTARDTQIRELNPCGETRIRHDALFRDCLLELIELLGKGRQVIGVGTASVKRSDGSATAFKPVPVRDTGPSCSSL